MQATENHIETMNNEMGIGNDIGVLLYNDPWTCLPSHKVGCSHSL